MKKLAVACALLAACIAAISGTAAAHTTTRDAAADTPAITWGVADDGGKYADDGGKCYATLHASDADAEVIGFGLSPRSNGPSQTAPIPFIKGVGAALKASGRTTRIMDEMSVHPYPNPNSPADSPDVGYANEDFYGIPNLDRVKQAVYDAFKGTPQPTTVGLVSKRSVK